MLRADSAVSPPLKLRPPANTAEKTAAVANIFFKNILLSYSDFSDVERALTVSEACEPLFQDLGARLHPSGLILEMRQGTKVTSEIQSSREGASDDAGPQKPAHVRSSQPTSAESPGFLRGAISIFILFNLVAITSWAVPLNVPPLREIKELVRPYLLWTGLFQSWDFFAPNPRPVNSYIEAVAVTQNRHIRVFDFPRMEQLSYGKRYREERYRKFAEVLCDPHFAALWPDVAKRVARLLTSASDPPQMVILMKFEAPILYGATPAQELAPKSQFFYEYYVSGEDPR